LRVCFGFFFRILLMVFQRGALFRWERASQVNGRWPSWLDSFDRSPLNWFVWLRFGFLTISRFSCVFWLDLARLAWLGWTWLNVF
jgi:hypothetical protein